MIMSPYKRKSNRLKKELSLKNENISLKGDIRTQLKVLENLSKFENRPCKGSVTSKDKMNVNYKSDDSKIIFTGKLLLPEISICSFYKYRKYCF